MLSTIVKHFTSRLPHGHNDDEKDLWSFENVAQAQSEDPDIGPVVDQLRINCCGNGRNQPMRNFDPCCHLKEPGQLRAEWSYLRNLLKNRSWKFMMVKQVPT